MRRLFCGFFRKKTMRELLPILPRPSRYAGIEEGAVRKQPDEVRLRVALAFPDLYEVGMSYLGQKILYGIVNAHESWWAERVMAPDRAAGDILRQHQSPLCTLESDTPLAKMDCVAFSITHELCYANVLYMLDLGGIPLRHAHRSDDLAACPLVIAGGGAALGAEALAPFMDLMVLGDGEESLPEILRLLECAREKGWGRRQFLEEARHISGVYVPSFFTPGKDGALVPLFADHGRPARRIVEDLERALYPARQVIPVGAVHNRLSLEIARGCTRGCRFCQAGMVYRPVRERSPESLASLLNSCLRETGFEEVSFLSLSSGDYSALKSLCLETLAQCSREQVALSLPSLRVGSIDDEIMAAMGELRRTGCTLAPEAGSQRLRDVINKGISHEDIILHAQKLLEHGWRQVKLYFMIGLPTETDEDLAAIADLCLAVRDAAGRGGPRLQVTASLSPFVPKPFTPFQWEGQISREEIERRVRFVRERFKGQKQLKLRWHEPAMSFLEGILSRADRSLADVVELAWRKGALFDSWMEGFDLAPWLEALAECGISPEECTGPREPGAPLAWGHLEAGISQDFLLRERERALAGKATPDCRYGACRHCGACDTEKGPSLLAPASRENESRYGHRLVFKERDQAAHKPLCEEDVRQNSKSQRQAPPRIAQDLIQKAAQYRFWHTKSKGSAYLSQLELQATLERALRRAGLPLAFSQGFHPLPLLSFGRALPVGVESDAEWFALTLRRIVPPKEAALLLDPHLPPGMRLRLVEFAPQARRIEQSVAEIFSCNLQGANDGDLLARRLEEFAKKSEVHHTRETRNGPRSMDLRPLLLRWAPRASGGVTFTLDWTMSYLSPLLFILAVLGPEAEQPALRARLRLCKTAQLFEDGRIFPVQEQAGPKAE